MVWVDGLHAVAGVPQQCCVQTCGAGRAMAYVGGLGDGSSVVVYGGGLGEESSVMAGVGAGVEGEGEVVYVRALAEADGGLAWSIHETEAATSGRRRDCVQAERAGMLSV